MGNYFWMVFIYWNSVKVYHDIPGKNVFIHTVFDFHNAIDFEF